MGDTRDAYWVLVRRPEGKRPFGRTRRRWENIKTNHEVGWAGHVARMGDTRGAYWVLVRRPEGKRPLGRPRRRWENNIKMDHLVSGMKA
jgi:hypothetical protein